ncbi:MAG: ABC transporter substrate-binding protein [Firmicutes bacterium]|nr:ABC transporter substrate-binding protein [Bacillota bacterium]
MKKKVLAILLIAILAMTLLSACGGSSDSGSSDSSEPAETEEPAEEAEEATEEAAETAEPAASGSVVYEDGYPENVLRITFQEEPETADPAMTSGDYLIMMNCMDTLTKMEDDGTGTLVSKPWLAESWEVSEDGLTYSFKLREDVKFHNGEPLTADDVLYSIDRMLQPERMTKGSEWMSMIAGAQDMLDGKAETVENIGVIVKDDYNFDIVLAGTYSPFLSMLSVPNWAICNREAGDKADEAGGGAATSLYGSDPDYFTGTGPFILKEWVLNDHLYLEKNPDYFAGASQLDGILVRIVADVDAEKMLFDSHQTDIFILNNAPDQIDYYYSSDEYKDYINTLPVLGTAYLALNEKKEGLNDPRVREAISLAIDRESICTNLFNNGKSAIPAYNFLPEGVAGYVEAEATGMNQEKAKELLKEAGYENGLEFELTTTSTDPESQAINEVIQNMLQQVGINCTINQMDSATWSDVRRTGDLGSYRTSWSADYNDPDNFYYSLVGGASNVTRSFNYDNQEILDLIESARYIVDVDERTAAYEKIENAIVHEDYAIIPLWHTIRVRALQPRVKGFVPMWAGWQNNCYYGVYLEG